MTEYWNSEPACAAPTGTVVFEGPGLGGFSLPLEYGNAAPKPSPSTTSEPGNGPLTYDETQQLPTNPAPLKAWLARYERTDISMADALIALQFEVPAPPRVRAAAYRVLASFPDVKNLGPVKGGQELLISFPSGGGWIKLVVDPATSLVRNETDAKVATTIEAAGWTNQLPRVVSLRSGTSC
ncbi:MAG: hypothetical protein ABSA93_02845 [Streptosporangiaceae bacterium]|jgi:hypothetical protein